MTTQRVLAAAVCGVAGATTLVQAQTAHYPNGVEGIKSGSLPPPGIYLRDYNYGYLADRFSGGPKDFSVSAYIQAPRVIWISDFKLLGGSLGADILVPFVYQQVKFNPAPPGPVGRWENFGIGDVCVEPLTLSWHQERYDLGVGYAFWAPTGEFDKNYPPSPGKGYWGHMITAGGTYYFDSEKTWAVSLLNRYEINQENDSTATTTGNAWTVEGGLSKTLNKTIDVGLVGYVQAKVTKDSGPAAKPRDSVVGVGPEVSVFFPSIVSFASLRWVAEFGASDRPEGHMINLTLTKRF